jgi:hypothetical protein
MSVSYRIDHASGVVFTTGAGVVTDRDILEHKARLLAEPGWRPGMRELADVRSIDRLEVTSDGVRLFASHDDINRTALESFRLAIVTASDATFGMGRMYQMMTERNVPHVRVFRDFEAARTWLNGE